MRILIESTDTVTSIDGVEVRLWRGTTGEGNRVEVYVHRIGTDDPRAQAELERAVSERPRPVELAAIEAEATRGRAIDLRHII